MVRRLWLSVLRGRDSVRYMSTCLQTVSLLETPNISAGTLLAASKAKSGQDLERGSMSRPVKTEPRGRVRLGETGSGIVA